MSVVLLVAVGTYTVVCAFGIVATIEGHVDATTVAPVSVVNALLPIRPSVSVVFDNDPTLTEGQACQDDEFTLDALAYQSIRQDREDFFPQVR